MISVELTRFFKAVEGGLELEASKYKVQHKIKGEAREETSRILATPSAVFTPPARV